MAARDTLLFEPAQTKTSSDRSLQEVQEDTRSKIAKIFICSYLAIIVLLIILATFFNLKADVSKDFLLAIGTPLGFIIGYYFKSLESGK